MAEMAGFPYYPIEFNKAAELVDPRQADALLEGLRPPTAPTDLFVVSHGWNNDIADAQDLYRRLLQAFRSALDEGLVPGVAGRTFAIMGVLWPSKKFADAELIPGGAASLTPAAGAAKPSLPATALQAQLDRLGTVFDHPRADALIDEARSLVGALEDSPAAQRRFADIIRELPGRKEGSNEDATDQFFAMDGADLLKRLAPPTIPTMPGTPRGRGGSSGGAAGGPGLGGPGVAAAVPGRPGLAGQAAGIGDWFSGARAGALNLLNFTTYYQMKERAGTIGAGPANALLDRVRKQNAELRIHLIGHSFGGRLVTAAAAGPARFAPSSMTLLQAAFSHNGFSADYDGKGARGFFRKVVEERRVNGPILISYSDKDSAVGIAYPLASRVNGEQAAALGDRNDRYGGIGRNGAVHTSEATDGRLLKARATGYSFAPGRLFNLNADAIIGGHSDICRTEVAYAVLTAVAGT